MGDTGPRGDGWMTPPEMDVPKRLQQQESGYKASEQRKYYFPEEWDRKLYHILGKELNVICNTHTPIITKFTLVFFWFSNLYSDFAKI